MKIKRFEFNMFPVNCYVISDETGEAAIIDAGCFFPEEQQMLKQYIADGTKSKDKCPQCGHEEMAYQNGCLTCMSCGYSKCG